MAQSHGTGCQGLVADGVRLAQEKDLSGAERLLADAAYQCGGAAPFRELAGVRLLQRRWPEVTDLAGRAVAIDPGDAHAWRLLGTARYVGGDQAGALAAWNQAGEPTLDLVSVAGLQRTTHRAAERAMGLETGVVLTPTATARASRRLQELPAALATRLEFVPRGTGRAEVRAHVVERPMFPRGAIAWAAIGLRAAAQRELGVGIASLGQGGERLDASWRFWPDRPAAGVALHVPAGFGLMSIELMGERQPFDDPTIPRAARLTTQARLADWATGTLRWEVRGGLSRWDDLGSFGTAGASARIERGRATVTASLDAWLGDRQFGSGTLHGRWRSSPERRGLALDVSGGLEVATIEMPLDRWPAGDTGHARHLLLRAHPVIDDGRLRVSRLGRRFAQASVEGQHWWRAKGIVPVGAAIFVDTGRTWARRTGSAVADTDVGAGLRLALPGRSGEFRLDVAHGLRDGHDAVSVSWSPF